MHFYKICGAGNDYLYLYKCDFDVDYGRLSKKISDRHYGVGGDGLIVLEPDKDCDCRMTMYNSDGSRGKICGNGVRGAVFLLSRNLKKSEYAISTDSGIKRAKTLFANAERGVFTVNMGGVKLLGGRDIKYNNKVYRACFADAGNLHAVVFCDNPQYLIERAETIIERENLFDYNVEFVKRENDGSFTIFVYEKGSGRTLSCGSGACAIYACALDNCLINGGEATLRFEGGKMLAYGRDGEVYLTGSSAFVCEGEFGGEK